MESVPRVVQSTVYCPVAQRSVTVRFLATQGSRATEIVSCTGYGQVDVISCGTVCLSDEGWILATAQPIY